MNLVGCASIERRVRTLENINALLARRSEKTRPGRRVTIILVRNRRPNFPWWSAAPIVVALAAAAAWWWWWGATTDATLVQRVPGTDRSPGEQPDTPPRAPLVGEWAAGEGVPAEPASGGGVWPQFRGPGRDGIAEGQAGLARTWPTGGPREVWRLEVGEGYAGAAVANGRVYLLDYDRDRQRDALRCLSPIDGREIWRYSYPVKVKRNHGMSRTVPAVADGFVVALGPKCQVMCLDAETGEERWLIDLAAEYGTEVPPWYAGQCPLIDEGRAILAPAGPEALLVARDCATGKEIWRTPNPRRWRMTHSSVMPMTLCGRKMYVYCGSGGVAGVDATTGERLWDTTQWQIGIATVPSPIAVGDDRIFLSGGYNAGSMMLKIEPAGDRYAARPLFGLEAAVFGAAQQTPIVWRGHIYGVRPDGQLTCLDLDGSVRWTSGADRRFGLGPFTMTDAGLLYVMDDHATLTLVDVAVGRYKELASSDLFRERAGHDAWGPMALADGRLYVRDLTRLVCLAVGAAE